METQYHKPAKAKRLNKETAHKLPKPKAASLADHDARYLLKRGVTDEVAEAAGYWTAYKPSEHPDEFSRYQRRRNPTLIAPHLSPDGVSVGYQKRDLRPGRTHKGKVIKWASPKGARLVLSTHPWTVDEVRRGTGRLWTPEGLTRLHALTNLGEVAVSYAGCHAWKQDGKPLQCWDHVNLNGRLVLDVPDADYRTNQKVQDALKERVEFLESRGARVLVVSVPEVNGDPAAGLDDYIASGGDLEALVREARPFVPVDAGRERLKRDEGLRLGIGTLRRALSDLESRRIGDCTDLNIARYMVEVSAAAHGKPLASGIKVRPSLRQIAAGVRVSVATVSNALGRLENEAGFLKLVEKAQGPKAATYLLFYPPRGGSEFVEHIEGSGVGGKESQECKGEGETSLYKRESSSSVQVTRGVVKSAVGREKVPEKVPALRNSKLVHTFARKGGRRVVVDSAYFWRYGKKREEMFRYVLELGGTTEADLHAKFGTKCSRLREFRRVWIKPMVDDGVLLVNGSDVLPATGWRVALDEVQIRTDEKLDNRLQDIKIADQQRAFRQAKDLPTDPTPELAGPERMAEIVARAEKRDREVRVEEQRRKVGMTAEVFLADALQDAVSGFGWRELRALWMAKGGKAEDLRLAVRNPYQFRRDHDSGPLYVVKAIEGHSALAEREPAPVAVLGGPKMPEKVDGIYHHDAFCDCDWCETPVQPSYARVRA